MYLVTKKITLKQLHGTDTMARDFNEKKEADRQVDPAERARQASQIGQAKQVKPAKQAEKVRVRWIKLVKLPMTD